MKVKAGIIGGAGYTGGELIRLLIQHPSIDVQFIHSRSQAGKAVHTVHQDLLGEMDLVFSGSIPKTEPEVLFLCLGHGESKKFLIENPVSEKTRVIDLTNDFRLKGHPKINEKHFVYGLPELNREKIKTAYHVANPGCFATAIQLGLLPLAKAGLLNDIYTTGITGSTGAGQALSPTSHFSWRENNIQPYKTLTHQHMAEIMESLEQLQSKGKIDLGFVPWRGDFTRGIFVSSQIRCDESVGQLNELFQSYYEGHPFVSVSEDPIFLKQVVNTNKAMIQLEKAGNKVVIHSAIDNLLKGASGQAVQNMNLMFGLEESTGLKLKANYF